MAWYYPPAPAPVHDKGSGITGVSPSNYNYKTTQTDYLVEPGDTLGGITKKVYGRNSRFGRDRVRKGGPIQPGVTLRITL